MMLISAMTLKSEFSIENCTSFCCTKDNHIDGVQINHEMISIQCSIDTNVSSLSLKIGAHDFFFFGISWCDEIMSNDKNIFISS